VERPALKKLLDAVRTRRVDVIVVYKVDRLTRSLADFAKLVELFDEHRVSFVSVTQAFNTTTSMGRLTLNVLYLFRGTGRRDRSHRSTRKGSLGRRGAQLRRRAFGDRRSRLRSDRRAPALGAIYPGKGAGGALAACRTGVFGAGWPRAILANYDVLRGWIGSNSRLSGRSGVASEASERRGCTSPLRTRRIDLHQTKV